jgi:hypothetical protein
MVVSNHEALFAETSVFKHWRFSGRLAALC